jgi:hypothetical protein
MDFLPSLRLANLFGPNSRNSGFGQPEIDNGNVGQMMRQLIPAARTANEEEHRRRKDLMTHQANLELPGRRNMRRGIQGSMPEGGRGPLTRSSMPAQNVNAPQGGLSPVQAMWGAERNAKLGREHASQMQDNQLSERYRAAMAERELQDKGSMDRLLLELKSREGIAGRENISQEAIEDKKHARSLSAAELAHQRDRDRITHQANETRRTNLERPDQTPQSAMDIERQTANRATQLVMKDARIGQFLAIDPKTKQWAIKPNTPAQVRAEIERWLYR